MTLLRELPQSQISPIAGFERLVVFGEIETLREESMKYLNLLLIEKNAGLLLLQSRNYYIYILILADMKVF